MSFFPRYLPGPDRKKKDSLITEEPLCLRTGFSIDDQVFNWGLLWKRYYDGDGQERDDNMVRHRSSWGDQ